jgi:four helix bundle protein
LPLHGDVVQSEKPTEKSFRDLLVWRKAHEFVLAVYRYTSGFPRQETYGLALQMRRAAVSVPANIAEGFTRRGKTEKARFMNIAEGSLEESRYYLILARDLGYGKTSALMTALEEVSRLLNAYARAILASGFHIPLFFSRISKAQPHKR